MAADVERVLATIRQRESGGRYTAKNPTSTASGAYQFINSTWKGLTRRFGVGTQYANAASAPPQVQDEVARRYVQSILQSNGDNVAAVPAIWYVGHVPSNPNYVPAGGNRLTVAQYVSTWMGAYNGGVRPDSTRSATPTTAPAPTAGSLGPITSTTKGGEALTEEQAVQKARETFGYLAWALEIPDIRAILVKAAREGWTPDRVQGAVANTDWWKSTSDMQRQWLELVGSDPATADQRRAEKRRQIEDAAQRLGITVAPDKVQRIAEDALRFGWDDGLLQRALANEMGGQTPDRGDAATLAAQYRQIARDYGIQWTEQGIQQYVKGTIAGTTDEDGFRAANVQMAKGRWDWMAPDLDRGQTVRQIMDPYFGDASRLLERAPDSFDVYDPIMRQAMDFVDPQSGKRRQMSLWEFDRTVRSSREYDGTKQARDKAYDALFQLGRGMGVNA